VNRLVFMLKLLLQSLPVLNPGAVVIGIHANAGIIHIHHFHNNLHALPMKPALDVVLDFLVVVGYLTDHKHSKL
jgi:hypothetical protein